ncbi:MAG: thiamine pyrophosphate-binding protein, partial [Alphaproteobacteria bacterium]|nr:thiamine pyrophosphate-binding protein [Alphaproteobacteria bacterium]
MNGAEWLARALAQAGTTHIFFIDAVLRRMLVEAGDFGITRVLVHSEKAAAYMADGYARVAGRPGICMAQSVGAANLASGLQDAYLGRSPMIALTGRKPPSFQHRNAYQEIAHAPLFEAVTKLSTPVAEAADLPRLLRLAWRSAMSGMPRPVHLDFAGLQGEIVELGEIAEPPVIDSEIRTMPPHRPVADERDIERAARAIVAARRVAIVAGEGAALSQAGPEILAVAEALAAPVATALGGRGVVPTRHPLSAGVVGSYSAPPANRIVHGADLVLFVGCDTGDQTTLNWTVPARDTPVVQIDIDPLEIGRSYANTIGVVGDPKASLAQLLQAIGRPPRDRAFAEEAARLVADWRASVAALVESDRAPITVERLCAEVTRALPDDGILVADTGYSGIWTGTMVELNGTGQSYLRAAGSLGWAFPASLGAKCAAPDRKVICFTGDGGFYYHLAELETARRRGIAVTVVVNNNSGFGQSVTGVRRLYGNRPGNAADLVRFGPTDFTEVARSFGVRGIRVERPGMLASALAEAVGANEPVVLDVVSDIEPRAPEPWT